MGIRSHNVMEEGPGVSSLWSSVNHIALVVSNVGRSLTFYSNIVGMKQVMRPNFDRHGAWLTFGNIDLHLIKGRPSVHPDDDLIVSHIAITVSDMAALKQKFVQMGVTHRKNVSVPNPADADTGIVEQFFVRDPDGYYLEFCNCQLLESYLHKKMAEDTKKWNFNVTKSAMNVGKRLKMVEQISKDTLEKRHSSPIRKTSYLEEDLSKLKLDKKMEADPIKLGNLIKRRKIYGDITQNVTEDELAKLLRYFNNHVPSLIGALEEKVLLKGSRTFIPPAFFGRDGIFVQPPSFEMAVSDVDKIQDQNKCVEECLNVMEVAEKKTIIRHEAATTIQASFKGMKARDEVKKMKFEKRLSDQGIVVGGDKSKNV